VLVTLFGQTMTAEPAQQIPPKPAPMTFGELMHHYLAMGNALYDAKVKGNEREAHDLERMVNAMIADLTKAAADGGFEKQLKDVLWNERGSAKRTLWIRMTVNRLKATKPGLLSLELLGSGGVVIAVAYYIVHTDTLTALLSGIAIIVLRLSLPWVMDAIATREERKLRQLRRVDESQYT
jgi:hypothetical protein